MAFMHYKKWCVSLLALPFCFTACSFQHDVSDDIDDYAERLSRVLEVPLSAVTPVQRLQYPAENTLSHELMTFEISLPEFYAVQSCQLGSLVAERNTVLGKQQEQAATLVYEKALIAELSTCISALRDTNPMLTDKLAEWHAQKQEQNPRVWANLIQSSRETRLAFSQSSQLLTSDNENDDLGGLTALAYLINLKNDPAPRLSELNRQLKIFESSRVTAKLWRTQNLLAARLNDLNEILQTALPEISCEDGRASQQAEILRNVFYLFFIEKIQPVSSKLNHFQYQLAPMIEQLLTSSAIQSAFKHYIDERNADFQRYKQAMGRHVELWQALLGRCNLSPQKRG